LDAYTSTANRVERADAASIAHRAVNAVAHATVTVPISRSFLALDAPKSTGNRRNMTNNRPPYVANPTALAALAAAKVHVDARSNASPRPRDAGIANAIHIPISMTYALTFNHKKARFTRVTPSPRPPRRLP
tara:strand:- start:94 stop:489 length:396 start_codon:yes stop_codon:yes gene_type:complete